MASMLQIGIGPKSSYLLTTTGCKTGQPRTTPVILVEADGQRWLVSPYGQVSWVHNVRAVPEVSLRRGRTTQALYAREVEADTAGPVLKSYVRQVRVTAPFFDAKVDDPIPFHRGSDRHPVFELTPTQAAG